MTRIEKQARIDASKEHVWDVVADFGGVVKYNPNLSNSYATSENNSGVGATRHCDLLPMGSIEERVLDWTEGEEYTLEIFKGKRIAPFRFARARIKVETEGSQTVASIVLDYRLKYGPLGALLNALVVKSQLSKGMANLMNGLKYYSETGQKATREAIKKVHVAA